MAHREQPSDSNPRENEGSINRAAVDRVATVGRGMPIYLAPQLHEILDKASVQLAEKLKPFEVEDGNGVDDQAPKETPERASNGHEGSFGNHTGGVGARTKTMVGQGYSYAHASQMRFGNQQSIPTRRNQIQVNYMNCMAARIPAPGSLLEELQAKERMRVQLIAIAQKALESYALENGYTIGSKVIDFKCCGSLRSGFMLPKAGLDLVAKIHASVPMELVKACPRIMEKAFLEAGYGAIMISNPQAFMIKMGDKPSAALLAFLRNQASSIELGHFPMMPDLKLPPSGAGVRCAIDFSGRLALYSAELLRCYALYDERVRLVGIFVKLWAQNREIDDLSNGTLCSHGYTLMVIHYLMNVVHPPVIPNLQTLSSPGHVEVANVNGYDVRFFNDEAELRAMSKSKGPWKNTQSVGELLCGFFEYYSMRKANSSQGCFNWANETISIRTEGGLRHKRAKGWYTARTDANGCRQRYLIAIEDPFELDRNVASDVTPSGLNMVQAEFRRAYTIINRVQEIPGFGWEWRTNEGDVGKDLLAKDRPHISNLQLINNQWDHTDCVPELCTRRDKPAPAPQPNLGPDDYTDELDEISDEQPSQERKTGGINLDPRQFHSPSSIRDRPVEELEDSDDPPSEMGSSFWAKMPIPS